MGGQGTEQLRAALSSSREVLSGPMCIYGDRHLQVISRWRSVVSGGLHCPPVSPAIDPRPLTPPAAARWCYWWCWWWGAPPHHYLAPPDQPVVPAVLGNGDGASLSQSHPLPPLLPPPLYCPKRQRLDQRYSQFIPGAGCAGAGGGGSRLKVGSGVGGVRLPGRRVVTSCVASSGHTP